MENELVRPGIYRHFKGNDYEVIGVAKMLDTEKWYVVYRPLKGDGTMHLREVREFTEEVTRDGITQPRFKSLET